MKNPMRKSEFARRCGVSRTRVGQWVKAKQIDGRAIVGTGRDMRIDADTALEQLNLRLDTDQRYGLKGLSTKLDWSPADPDDITRASFRLGYFSWGILTAIAAMSQLGGTPLPLTIRLSI